jgi:predicted PurR-regulated permease PerM
MEKPDKWHLSKAISISHLATTFALILAGVIYITGIEKDVAVLEANLSNLQTQIIQIQNDNKEMFSKIDKKLDQMISIIHQYQLKKDS